MGVVKRLLYCLFGVGIRGVLEIYKCPPISTL